jgi:hypothetical protein
LNVLMINHIVIMDVNEGFFRGARATNRA